ncbi:MAG: mercury(II) reductase [Candidatus Micrarchaeia archaeon]
MEEFKYAILGQGAAAFAAAIKANELGIKTVMIGKNATPGALIGGTCVNVGCVPSKRLISAGEYAIDGSVRKFGGVEIGKPKITFKELMRDKDQLISGMRASKYEDVLKGLENVSFIDGFASFNENGTISAGKREIAAEKILIATGAKASIPKIDGVGTTAYLTNEEALSLTKLPESITIVGGRAMGLEFAQIFSSLGSKVTVLQRSNTILPEWEPEVSSLLSYYLKSSGISIITGAETTKIGEEGGKKYVEFSVNGKASRAYSEQILFATGRAPNTDRLNLNARDIKTDKSGFIEIDKYMMTNKAGIYAAGDVTGNPMLETLAAKEGNLATQNAFTNAKLAINLHEVPNVVFTMPEAAMVGLTDVEANGFGIKCSCGVLLMSSVPKASIIGDDRGLVKIVIDYKTHKILGVSILARNASDMISEATLAVKFGLTIDNIIDTIHPFPTLNEALKLASISFYSDVSKMSCCTV